jgi:L-threonylcarbamoyladenylate synthase
MATRLLADDRDGVAAAVALLKAGALVAFATETVYGLGADATNARAVAAIFEAKGRPHFNPLICHYPDAAAAFRDVEAPALARRLAARFWPGPLTLVLPRRITCPVALLAGAGLETLAVRVPAHPAARALIRALGKPVAAPSANRSGRISPTRAGHVMADLNGRIAAILDSGPCAVGVESTVLDLSGATPFLLRPGGVPVETLEAEIGGIGRGIPLVTAEASRTLRSPGLTISHYAPDLPVRLNAVDAAPDEAWLGFGPAMPAARLAINLSPSGDPAEAAAGLFEALHRLDADAPALGLARIAVAPIPEDGLGLAINDRLARAAAPRL